MICVLFKDEFPRIVYEDVGYESDRVEIISEFVSAVSAYATLINGFLLLELFLSEVVSLHENLLHLLFADVGVGSIVLDLVLIEQRFNLLDFIFS